MPPQRAVTGLDLPLQVRNEQCSLSKRGVRAVFSREKVLVLQWHWWKQASGHNDHSWSMCQFFLVVYHFLFF